MMGNADSLDFAQNDPSVVIRVGRRGGGEREKQGAFSLDGGATWSPFPSEPGSNSSSGSAAVSADGSVFLWAPSNSEPFFSRDRGATWTASSGAPANLQIVTDRVNPARAYGIDPRKGTLYLSNDSGAHFTAAAKGVPTTGKLRLRASPDREGELYVCADPGGLYHSIDGGNNFERVPSIAEVAALGLGKAAPGEKSMSLYVIGRVVPGGVRGVFRSDDAGKSWIRINDDQHQYGGIGQAITGNPRIYGRVYLGTNGRGILYGDPVSR
jgi:photosystem II stability/assembly factor-like uncharacterized protein